MDKIEKFKKKILGSLIKITINLHDKNIQFKNRKSNSKLTQKIFTNKKSKTNNLNEDVLRERKVMQNFAKKTQLC